MLNDHDFYSDEDDDEETCPLCVEVMDLSDRNFKPCPCGYQICQFCYNNIRQNPDLNGRCPACRRPYDDESVEYKTMTAEELRTEQTKQLKKEKEKKQREKEKKENEQMNRKHLAGMRVIQKNLVYVVGLNPPVSPEDLIPTLKSEKYFGQYGKVLKAVINKKPPSAVLHHNPNNGFGVYITFSKKEEAARCIAAIDGTFQEGRQLKAAFGTTKYCSSYLRGQGCPNPNCMFLHEPGEEADSYTRQDLSTRQSLRMGGPDSYRSSPFPRHTATQHVNEESTTTNSSSTPVSTPVLSHQPLAGAAPLPVTASWATPKPQTTELVSNTTAATAATAAAAALANSSAFPSLAERATQQQMQQQQHEQKRKQRQQNSQQNDEFNPEYAASLFLDELISLAKNTDVIDYQLKPHLITEELTSCPPLFAYDSIKTTASEKDESFSMKLLKSFITKPQIPQVIQGGAPAQQTPYQQPINMAEPNQQLSQQIPQQQQQQLYPQNSVAQALIQQQLMQQRQQQQQQQQQPHQPQPQTHSAAQQILQEQLFQQTLLNKPKVADRSYAATPPPPGLLPVPQTSNDQVGGTASELLSHLMNGKKISA